MTRRRRRAFPIAIALLATTLAGCTAQDAPFGIGITGFDPKLPDAARGFCWPAVEHDYGTSKGEAYCVAQAMADEFVNGVPEPRNRWDVAEPQE